MKAESGNLIACRGLCKSFSLPQGELAILKDIDFSLPTGKTVSLVGESGSGKSTLLNVLAGLETADSGELSWQGNPIPLSAGARLAPRRAQFIGFVFQAYHLIPELNLLDNVLIARRLIGRVRSQDRERAAGLLSRVGLGERLSSRTQELSGGERQRVAVARALMNQPKVLLADEPTGNLDEKTSEHVMDLLFELVREESASLLLVTHNPAYARRTEIRWRLRLGHLEPES